MSILIQCPKCGRDLKLPDRSLLGRKGKCPKCSHSFILQEPVVVSSKDQVEKESQTGMSVPPLSPGSRVPVQGPAVSVSLNPSVVASETEKPESIFASVTAAESNAPSAPPFFLAMPEANKVASGLESMIPLDFAALGHESQPGGASARLKESQRRPTRRRNVGLAILAVTIVIAVGVMMFSPTSSIPKPMTNSENAAESVADSDSKMTTDSDLDDFDPAATEYAKKGSPTNGKPIELQYVPFGTQVVINVRPAELWKELSLGEEVRFCIPPLAKMIETSLNDLFKCQPAQVEELLICLIPGPRGSLPDVAAVAHMVEDQKRSQLVEQFGRRLDQYEQPVYVSGERAYLIADLKTLVVCPQGQADEMVQAITTRHPVEQIDPLLPMTDRDRHLTVILTPPTLSLHDAWFPENVRPFVKYTVEWLGEEIEAVSGSFHLTPELFYSEILLRNQGLSAKKLEQNFKQKLDSLAGTLVPLIEQMNPDEQGKRMVIGRLPAMIEVFSMATITRHGPRHVQFVTPLPDRAAPNIVLGTVLAWDESTRTDFTRAKSAPTEGSRIPATISERLTMKIDVDFRATPISEAFAYISGEIKTPIELDGDALKAGGFTKNLKQTFKRDAGRVQDIIVKIFEESKGIDANPDKNLVIIVDETKKSILVTTLAAANRKGLKPFDFR